jgi:hypothetical protein
MAETRGIIPISMEHPDPRKTLPFENFLKSAMHDSVREELCAFIRQENFLPEHEIDRLITQGLLIDVASEQPQLEQTLTPLQA